MTPADPMQHNQFATDLLALAEEIERAPADMPPDEESYLIENIHSILGHRAIVAGSGSTHYYVWEDAEGNELHPGWNCLSSRDDAHALLPKGCVLLSIGFYDGMGRVRVYFEMNGQTDSSKGFREMNALTSAALRARAAEMEQSKIEMIRLREELVQERALSERLANALENQRCVNSRSTPEEIDDIQAESIDALSKHKSMRQGSD